MGGTCACPLEGELDLVPLVSRAMSRDVFRGSYVLRTLGSLSPSG